MLCDSQELLAQEGVDLAFVPSAEEMYPPGRFATTVDPGPLFSGAGAQGGEAGARPHFFRGVATVCTKLLNVVQPHEALFGQKVCAGT